jgi:hypothetical protein
VVAKMLKVAERRAPVDGRTRVLCVRRARIAGTRPLQHRTAAPIANAIGLNGGRFVQRHLRRESKPG